MALLAATLGACGGPEVPRDAPPSTAAPLPSSSPLAANATASPLASSAAQAPIAAAARPAHVTLERARALLFPEGVPSDACQAGDDHARVRCLITLCFDGHAAEQSIALSMFDARGDVVGLEETQDMEGGFRGLIHLVPELPVGRYAKHLGWVRDSQADIAGFLDAIRDRATSGVRYRNEALAFRFMRSVGRTTPSAYAMDWEIAYNVSGSLHSSGPAVTETLFHELFHLNDGGHHNWSRRVLGPIADAIVAKCGAKTPCLAPYAPGKTMVRGGTFYAFQSNNGDIAHEYSAELATRYFIEQRARLAGEPVSAPFKCGPKENREAWDALVGEFFGGVDLVPACR